METIRVAIAEDQPIVLNGLALILKGHGQLKVTILAENGKALLDQLENTKELPHAVLMDLDMPVMNGFEATKLISEHYPDIKIVFLTSHINLPFIEKAILLGGHGYLSKDAQVDEIHDALLEVTKQGFYFNEFISYAQLKSLLSQSKIKPNFDLKIKLSPREIDFIRLICKEKTDQEIANELFISTLTAESYRKTILRKLGVKKSVGIAVFAVKNNLV